MTEDLDIYEKVQLFLLGLMCICCTLVVAVLIKWVFFGLV